MKKTWLVLVLAMFLITSLTGCKISLSTPPPPTEVLIETPFATSVGVDQLVTPVIFPTRESTAVVVVEPPQARPTETPQPPQVVALPTLERPTTYTLQKGEWPICIARRYDLNLDSFFAANGLTMNSRPAVGTVLKIPATGTWDSGARALKTHPASYTVRAGDTIYTIACDFGDVDPNAIVVVNNLVAPYTLQAGQVLQIP